jgi:hypothetical protein
MQCSKKRVLSSTVGHNGQRSCHLKPREIIRSREPRSKGIPIWFAFSYPLQIGRPLRSQWSSKRRVSLKSQSVDRCQRVRRQRSVSISLHQWMGPTTLSKTSVQTSSLALSVLINASVGGAGSHFAGESKVEITHGMRRSSDGETEVQCMRLQASLP